MELSHPVSEGTVRNFKHKYLEQLKSVTDPDLVTSLPSAAVSRPLLIGKFDDKVAEYIRYLRLSGGIVTVSWICLNLTTPIRFSSLPAVQESYSLWTLV